MARVSKGSSTAKSAKKSVKKVARKVVAKAKRPSAKKAGGGARKASAVTRQMKETAMKVLAGAASGAVQALIPPLEDAAGRTAKSAGMDQPAPASASRSKTPK